VLLWAARLHRRRPAANARRRSSRLRSDRGVALVEFALIAPILFLVLFAILDFGRAINYWQDASHLSSEAARYAAVSTKPAGCTTTLQQCIQEQADTSELRNGSSSVLQRLRVCVTYPNAGATTAGNPAKVTATFRFQWLPIIGLGATTISADATMRLEKDSTNAAGCYP
jgi:Flp pilus assembly protein TadG